MALNNLHIEPSDIVIVPFSGGYEIRVERVNSKELCERCICLEETLISEYHLFLDVCDFEYSEFLLMTLRSFNEYTEEEIQQIIASEINNLI